MWRAPSRKKTMTYNSSNNKVAYNPMATAVTPTKHVLSSGDAVRHNIDERQEMIDKDPRVYKGY